MTCTAVYTITQADMDAGSVNTTATVTAKSAAGCGKASELVEDSDGFMVRLTTLPGLAISMTADVSFYIWEGQEITFSFLVQSVGNVPVFEAIQVVDDLAAVTCPELESTGLVPGDSITCTGTYTTTLEDVRNAEITTSAVATAGEVSSETVSLSIPLNELPSLTLTKSASPSAYTYVGQKITFSFLVKNTGNVFLTPAVEIVDDSLASWSCPALTAGELAPGESITCTGTYTIAAGDLGISLKNTALARATYMGGIINSNQSVAFVFFVPPPTPTTASVTGCAQYTDFETCMAQPGCIWSTGECVSNP